MAGFAGSSALTRTAAAVTPRYEFSIAGSVEDAEVRRILRERPLDGAIALSFEREPDGRIAAAVEGDVHQTIVARDRSTGRIAAIASRSVHDAFVNGQPARVGYLGQLRLTSPPGARRELFDRGFEFCRSLHEQGDAALYLLSTAADNTSARRLLTGFPSRHAPRVKPIGIFRTLVFDAARGPVASGFGRTDVVSGFSRTGVVSGFGRTDVVSGFGRTDVVSGFSRTVRRWAIGAPPRQHEGIEFRRASGDFLDEIAACLDRNGRRFQFARVWRPQDLVGAVRTPDLSLDDFVVATCGGHVVGCVAVWDQRQFKQTVVRGYHGNLLRWRRLINAGGRILGTPVLPPAGTRLEMATLSHFALDPDVAHAAPLLVRHAAALAPRNATHLVLGLAAENPIAALLVRTLRHRSYETLLQMAYWPDGARDALMLDARLPQPEAATL